MKRIFTREQYLSQYKKHYSVNEMIESDVNWGDSLVGRMINSILRKAEIGYNMMRMKNIIKLLKNRFETMSLDVQMSDVPAKEKIIINISARLQTISKHVVKGSSSKKVISLVIEAEEALNNIREIEGVTVIVQKLGEYKTFLLEGVGAEAEGEKVKELGVGKTVDPDVKELGTGKEEQGEDGTLEIDEGGLPKHPEKVKIEEIPTYKEKYNKAIESLRSRIPPIIEKIRKIKSFQTGKEKTKELGELYTKIFQEVHPDKVGHEDKLAHLLGSDVATEISQIVADIKGKVDMKAMTELWSYIEQLLKIHNQILHYTKIHSDFVAREKAESSKKDGKQDLLGTGEKVDDDKRLQSQSENFEHLSNYRKFYEKKVGIEVTTEEMTSKFEEIFTSEVIADFTITQENVTELKKYERSGELIMKNPDHIIEIVRLFKRAYRIHTTSVIQSGRTDGKVSNSVFREYEHLGSNPGTPAQPGSGPWRNIKLYDQWESAVFDILAENKYKTTIFSDDCVFTFVSDDTTVTSDKKLGKILLNFITKLLSDSKMYTGSGALPAFLKEYFGLTVDLSDTAMSANGKSDNDVNQEVTDKIVKTKVRYEKQKNVSNLKGDTLFEWFRKLKTQNTKLPKGIAFRIKNSDGKWIYFVLAHQTNEVTYFYRLTRFGFDTTNIEIDEKVERSYLYLSIFLDGGQKLRYINITGKETTDNDISLDEIEVLVNMHGKLFTGLKVLNGLDFGSTTAINTMSALKGS
jgi:hypothetical protein